MTGKPPFQPTGLDHLLLVVRGMDRAIAFYRDVVGCEVSHRLDEYAMADLTAGVTLVDIAAEEGAWARKGDGENLNHFAIALAPAREADVRGHLAAHGAMIEEERVENGRLSLYIRDPSGNQVELIFQPLP